MTLFDDGPFLQPLEQMRTILSKCYWWQRIEDEGNPWDEATARAHTYIDVIPRKADGKARTRAELESLRPWAIFWTESFQSVQQTSGPCLDPVQGAVGMTMVINMPDPAGATPDGEYAERIFGRVYQTGDPAQPGILDLIGPETLAVRVAERFESERVEEQDVEAYGDFAMCSFRFQWGLVA